MEIPIDWLRTPAAAWRGWRMPVRRDLLWCCRHTPRPAADPGHPIAPRRPRPGMAIAGAAMWAALQAGWAEGANESDDAVRLSGFGAVTLVQTDRDEVEYTPQPGNHANGARKGHWSADLDSVLAAQLNAEFSEIYSGVVQVLARRRAENDFQPEVEWAFLSLRASPGLHVRLGRLGTPFYMLSDYRSLLFAGPWVRPPADVYGQVLFSRHDGLDLLFKQPLGMASLSLQGYVGGTETRFWAPPSSVLDLQLTNAAGLNVMYEQGPYLLRYGYHRAVLKGSSDRIDAVVRALSATPSPLIPASAWAGACPGCAAAAADLAMDDKRAVFQGIGLVADWPRWHLSAEYTGRSTETGALAATRAWYLSAASRLGRWTPFVVVSRLRQVSTSAEPRIAVRSIGVAAVDAATPAIATTLATAVNGVLTDRSQRTTSAGVRLDLLRNLAFKAQWDRLNMTGSQHNGLSAVSTPAAGFDGRLNAYSLSADFVF